MSAKRAEQRHQASLCASIDLALGQLALLHEHAPCHIVPLRIACFNGRRGDFEMSPVEGCGGSALNASVVVKRAVGKCEKTVHSDSVG